MRKPQGNGSALGPCIVVDEYGILGEMTSMADGYGTRGREGTPMAYEVAELRYALRYEPESIAWFSAVEILWKATGHSGLFPVNRLRYARIR